MDLISRDGSLTIFNARVEGDRLHGGMAVVAAIPLRAGEYRLDEIGGTRGFRASITLGSGLVDKGEPVIALDLELPLCPTKTPPNSPA